MPLSIHIIKLCFCNNSEWFVTVSYTHLHAFDRIADSLGFTANGCESQLKINELFGGQKAPELDVYKRQEANSDAQAAYEQLKANNRTYQFADEKTKKQIAYISDYYLQTVPESEIGRAHV